MWGDEKSYEDTSTHKDLSTSKLVALAYLKIGYREETLQALAESEAEIRRQLVKMPLQVRLVLYWHQC